MGYIKYNMYFLLWFVLSWSVSATPLPTSQTELADFKKGQQTLLAIKTQGQQPYAKNIVLFVGDGMGLPTISASSIVHTQQNKQKTDASLSFEKFPYVGLIKTYSTSAQTPDSASTMTAISTGVKTSSGMVSINPTIVRGGCDLDHQQLLTLLHYAQHKGKATGIISTARITHATPAVLYAQVSERNWENEVPSSCAGQVKDIATQLIEMETPVDVVLGGGAREFVPEKNTYNIIGKRKDNQDLIKAWQDKHGTDTRFVQTSKQLANINPNDTRLLLGLFSNSHMSYEADRAQTQEPSLTEMSLKALDFLKKNKNGFFMMIEAGRIDHAHHAGNAARALEDTLALSQAVDATIDYLKMYGLLDDTLIIVTADHSHVMTFSGNGEHNQSVLGLVKSVDGTPQKADDQMPYTFLSYTNGPGAEQRTFSNTRRHLTQLDTVAIDFLQPALIPLESETHGGEDVAIYATGPGSHYFRGSMEQNVIFHIINKVAKLNAQSYQPYFPNAIN